MNLKIIDGSVDLAVERALQSACDLDVAQVIYAHLENDRGLPALPSYDDFCAYLDELRPQLNRSIYNTLYNLFATAIMDSQEACFRLGWEMRGKI